MTSLYRNRDLQMIFGVTLMAIVGLALISPALPKVQDAFDLSKTQIGLMVTIFTIPGVIVSPLVGFISDKWNRKGMVIVSLLVFSLSGGSIAFLRDYNMILVMRFFQGAAASGLSTLSMALIGDAFTGHDRAVAMGYNASVLSVGSASYPVIGGLMASVAWFFPFYFFFLAIPISLVILKYMHIPTERNDGDYKSYLVMASRELYNKKFVVLISACIVSFIILYGPYMTYFPLYLDEVYGSDSFDIGIILAFMSITTGIISYHSGKIHKRIGSNIPMVIGFVFYSLAMVVMYLMTDAYVGILAACLYGVGQGFNIPILQTKFLNSVSDETRGVVSALFSSNLRLGQSIGPVLMGVLYTIDGYELVFLFSAALSISMGMVTLFAIKRKLI